MLVYPKDKIDSLDVNGVIYYHACAGTNYTPSTDDYVGESARAASTRNSEHFPHLNRRPAFSNRQSCNTLRMLNITSAQKTYAFSRAKTTGMTEEFAKASTFAVSRHH